MTSSASAGSEVPTWSGDPAEFETFSVACRWYVKSLKDSERKQAAFRVWAKLQGPAKAVVRHLNPDDYESEEGLSKLLEVLRTSPLQQLPVPDSFKRLDVWHHLRRNNGETIPQLLVREEDLFVQLQSALTRARQDRELPATLAARHLSGFPSTRDVPRTDPPSTPSRSPVGAQARAAAAAASSPSADPQPTSPPAAPVALSDFFEDELRGYRLLKAARLTAQERQNILTQTGNSTNFLAVRRALRTLFSEEDDGGHSSWKKSRIWWNAEDEPWPDDEDAWEPWESYDPGQQDWQEAYWQDWSPWTYDDWGDSQFDESWHDASPKDDLPVDDQADDPAETQYKEAYALANEANKTLAEARDAVRRVRQARGYFAPESMTGKGIPMSRSPSGSPKGKSGMGKSLGAKGKSFGPCFVCGLNGHSWRQCPDRFAKGGKGKSLFPKGKGKSKKGFKSLQYHDISPCFDPGIYTSDVEPGTRVIMDTGASENAVGMDSLGLLIEKGKISYDVSLQDRPVFKFGNGHKAQAVSRVDLLDTSIGTVSFYVLGDEANQTPPLMGGKTLRQLGAMLAYEDNLLIYKRQEPQTTWYAVKMHPHASAHVSIDLIETATPMSSFHTWFAEQVHGHEKAVESDLQMESEKVEANVFMLSKVSDAVQRQDRLSNLAQRLHLLRDRVCHGHSSPTMCGGRPPHSRFSMLQPSQTEGETEPVRNLVNMSGMRLENHLQAEEGQPWRGPPYGSPPSSDQGSHGSDRGQHAQGPSQRESGEWQAHGNQGPAVATWHQQLHGREYDLCPIHEAHGIQGGVQQEASKPVTGSKEGTIQANIRTVGDKDVGGSSRLPQEGRLGQLGCSEIRDSSSRCCEKGDGCSVFGMGIS